MSTFVSPDWVVQDTLKMLASRLRAQGPPLLALVPSFDHLPVEARAIAQRLYRAAFSDEELCQQATQRLHDRYVAGALGAASGFDWMK